VPFAVSPLKPALGGGGAEGACALPHGEAGAEEAPEGGSRELAQRSRPACFPGSAASPPEPAEGM